MRLQIERTISPLPLPLQKTTLLIKYWTLKKMLFENAVERDIFQLSIQHFDSHRHNSILFGTFLHHLLFIQKSVFVLLFQNDLFQIQLGRMVKIRLINFPFFVLALMGKVWKVSLHFILLRQLYNLPVINLNIVLKQMQAIRAKLTIYFLKLFQLFQDSLLIFNRCIRQLLSHFDRYLRYLINIIN